MTNYEAYQLGMERAAQMVRYYLKHQNFPSDWTQQTSYEQGETIASENLVELITKESTLPESKSRFRDA